jgi:hypothetical protein
MLAKQCDVLIYHSNLSTIPKTIYEHEIPVLEEIFGEGSVTKYERKELVHAVDGSGKELKYQVEAEQPVTYDIEDLEHDEEYLRMMDLYGKHQTVDVFNVTRVYGRIEDLKMEVKNKEKYENEPKPKPKELAVEEDDDLNYSNMSKMELKQMLTNLKVPYPNNATKLVLIDLAERSDKGELELEKVS